MGGSSWFILIHLGSSWFILVHLGSSWFILVHLGSSSGIELEYSIDYRTIDGLFYVQRFFNS